MPSGSGVVLELGGDQTGERVEEGHEVGADAEAWVGVDAEVVDCEAHRAGDGLGVEEGESSGDPCGKAELVVVEEAGEEAHVVLAAEPGPGPEGPGGHANGPGSAGVVGPADEGTNMPAGGGRLREPLVEVGLGEAGEVSVSVGEPAKELGGDGDGLSSGEDVAFAELRQELAGGRAGGRALRLPER